MSPEALAHERSSWNVQDSETSCLSLDPWIWNQGCYQAIKYYGIGARGMAIVLSFGFLVLDEAMETQKSYMLFTASNISQALFHHITYVSGHPHAISAGQDISWEMDQVRETGKRSNSVLYMPIQCILHIQSYVAP